VPDLEPYMTPETISAIKLGFGLVFLAALVWLMKERC
jgi:hypothetical protein